MYNKLKATQNHNIDNNTLDKVIEGYDTYVKYNDNYKRAVNTKCSESFDTYNKRLLDELEKKCSDNLIYGGCIDGIQYCCIIKHVLLFLAIVAIIILIYLLLVELCMINSLCNNTIHQKKCHLSRTPSLYQNSSPFAV